jgi:hypothetical protein
MSRISQSCHTNGVTGWLFYQSVVLLTKVMLKEHFLEYVCIALNSSFFITGSVNNATIPKIYINISRCLPLTFVVEIKHTSKVTKMKKLIPFKSHRKHLTVLALIIGGLSLPLLQSCQKYPDGPFISLHTRTERVAQTWRVDNYKKNGTDYTSSYQNYSESYTKDGGYTYSTPLFHGTGTWTFTNSDKDIQLTGISNQNSHTLIILKLEQSEFWYYYIDGGDKMEFHMVH